MEFWTKLEAVNTSEDARKRSGETRKAATRTAVLKAAQSLLVEAEERGEEPSFVTPKQVARRASVAVSSVYNHFPGGMGAIALELIEQAKARSDAALPSVVYDIARQQRVKAMASSDVEAQIRAEVGFLYARDHAQRARDLLRQVDNDASSSEELRYLCRTTLAYTLSDDLPNTRQEMLEVTSDAARFAQNASSFVVPLLSRLQMSDYRVAALLTPEVGESDVDDVNDAIVLLRGSAALMRTHGAGVTRDGWQVDALRREYGAAMLEMRDVSDAGQLRDTFQMWLAKLAEAVRLESGPVPGVVRPDALYLGELISVSVTLESLGLLSNEFVVEYLEKIDTLKSSQIQESRHGEPGYVAIRFAADVLHGRYSGVDEVPLPLLHNVTWGDLCNVLACIHLKCAIPERYVTVLSEHRRQDRVHFELLTIEAFTLDNFEVRTRLAERLSAARKATSGHTPLPLAALENLEWAVRRATETRQSFSPEIIDRMRSIWNSGAWKLPGE